MWPNSFRRCSGNRALASKIVKKQATVLLGHCNPNKTHLFTDEVLVHFTESGVGASVDRPAVDVVTVQIRLEDEDADVGQSAEVDELLNLMLEESLIDQRHKHPLYKC